MIDINIGLLGFGTVGSGVYNILKEDHNLINTRLKKTLGKDCRINIKKALVRDIDKYDENVKDILTTDVEEILKDEEIEIICELIGGEIEATEYMKKAIEYGKDVVTANKMAIFKDSGNLIDYAQEKDVHFRYEGSVAGVIPIIRVVEESLLADNIYEIHGILNGSTNYIMTKIKEGLSYEEAKELAFKKGYLEADPSSDIEGYDAMYKLGILGYLIDGEFPREEEIERIGIDNISEEDIKITEELDKKIKLISKIKFDGENKVYSVKPELIDYDNPLYDLDGSLNGILLKCKNGGDIFLSGAGAGSRETAISVLGDVLSIIRNKYN